MSYGGWRGVRNVVMNSRETVMNFPREWLEDKTLTAGIMSVQNAMVINGIM
jgi:hypothetical protein